MIIEKSPASHGLKWLVQGWVLLRRGFFVMLLFIVMLAALGFVANQVPFAGVVLALLTPVFLAGLMLGCRALEKGEELEIAHFFAGFQQGTANLLTLGGFYLIGNMVVLGVMYMIGGDALKQLVASQGQNVDPEVLAEALGPVMLALLTGLLLSLPLMMAVWFAPLLVVFRNLKPAEALRDSFFGCLRNPAAFLVYGLVLLVALIVFMLPFGLVSPERNPGLWLVGLFVLPSLYTSYRDIYRDIPDVPPTPEPVTPQ